MSDPVPLGTARAAAVSVPQAPDHLSASLLPRPDPRTASAFPPVRVSFPCKPSHTQWTEAIGIGYFLRFCGLFSGLGWLCWAGRSRMAPFTCPEVSLLRDSLPEVHPSLTLQEGRLGFLPCALRGAVHTEGGHAPVHSASETTCVTTADAPLAEPRIQTGPRTLWWLQASVC